MSGQVADSSIELEGVCKMDGVKLLPSRGLATLLT